MLVREKNEYTILSILKNRKVLYTPKINLLLHGLAYSITSIIRNHQRTDYI